MSIIDRFNESATCPSNIELFGKNPVFTEKVDSPPDADAIIERLKARVSNHEKTKEYLERFLATGGKILLDNKAIDKGAAVTETTPFYIILQNTGSEADMTVTLAHELRHMVKQHMENDLLENSHCLTANSILLQSTFLENDARAYTAHFAYSLAQTGDNEPLESLKKSEDQATLAYLNQIAKTPEDPAAALAEAFQKGEKENRFDYARAMTKVSLQYFSRMLTKDETINAYILTAPNAIQSFSTMTLDNEKLRQNMDIEGIDYLKRITRNLADPDTLGKMPYDVTKKMGDLEETITYYREHSRFPAPPFIMSTWSNTPVITPEEADSYRNFPYKDQIQTADFINLRRTGALDDLTRKYKSANIPEYASVPFGLYAHYVQEGTLNTYLEYQRIGLDKQTDENGTHIVFFDNFSKWHDQGYSSDEILAWLDYKHREEIDFIDFAEENRQGRIPLHRQYIEGPFRNSTEYETYRTLVQKGLLENLEQVTNHIKARFENIDDSTCSTIAFAYTVAQNTGDTPLLSAMENYLTKMAVLKESLGKNLQQSNAINTMTMDMHWPELLASDAPEDDLKYYFPDSDINGELNIVQNELIKALQNYIQNHPSSPLLQQQRDLQLAPPVK